MSFIISKKKEEELPDEFFLAVNHINRINS